MTTPLPSLQRKQRKVDADHLNLLLVFHVVFLVLGLFSAQAGDYQWLRADSNSGTEVSCQIMA